MAHPGGESAGAQQGENAMYWFTASLRKYATFGGRASRSEYWYFFLVYALIFVGLAVIDALFGTFDMRQGIGLFTGLFALATALPSVAVGVRRMHDIGRSGWWLLVSLVPVVGLIWLLIYAAREGEPGPNAWGAKPLQ